MRTLTLTVTQAMAGRKVKSILRRELSMAEGLIARIKLRPEGITLNSLRCRTVDTVKPGDILRVQVGDEPCKSPFTPMNIPLNIVYEDEDILILDKAPGMACHGKSDRGEPTLGSALAFYLGEMSAFHPINRLDKGTSGLMAAAKSAYVHDLMRRRLHSDHLRREYLLICSPPPKEKSGLIDLPIARDETSPIKRKISSEGAPAQTEYELLEECGGMALVRARLHTGRTHQIRVHFAAIGCPLVGDWLYGSASPLISRPALHSHLLELVHPIGGQALGFRSPLPADMAKLLEKEN